MSAAVCALVASCMFDESGIGPVPMLSVAPRFVCPGDPVTISWDTGVGNFQRHPDFCCGNSIGLGCIGDPGGCLPTIRGEIITMPTPLSPSLDFKEEPITDSRVFNPQTTTDVKLNASFWKDGDRKNEFTEIVTVKVVSPGVPLNEPIQFPWICGTKTWTAQTFEEPTPAYTKVQITHVTNTTGETIQLTHSVTGAADVVDVIASGQSSLAFNGPPAGTWTAKLTPAFIGPGPAPPCEPTQSMNGFPDISIEMNLVCMPPP